MVRIPLQSFLSKTKLSLNHTRISYPGLSLRLARLQLPVDSATSNPSIPVLVWSFFFNGATKTFAATNLEVNLPSASFHRRQPYLRTHGVVDFQRQFQAFGTFLDEYKEGRSSSIHDGSNSSH